MKKSILLVAAAMLSSVLLATMAMADTAYAASSEPTGPGLAALGPVYQYNGTTYIKGASQGLHKLSGYCPSAKNGRLTASGLDATAHHTIAYSSSLPLGTMVIIEGSSGPYPSEFDGLYFIEDRGDTHIEDEGWVDIFWDTLEEAKHVTDAGWNYANVYIAVPVEKRHKDAPTSATAPPPVVTQTENVDTTLVSLSGPGNNGEVSVLVGPQ